MSSVIHLLQKPDGGDCTRCGLCCTSPYADCLSFVELMGEDLARLPPGFRRRNVLKDINRSEIKARWLKQLKGSPMEGHQVHVCVAFRGSLGQRCSCSIYNDRPAVCREWQPRNKTCTQIRKRFVEAVREGRLEEAV